MITPLKVVGGSPIRSIKEVLAISNSDIRGMLEDLREKGKHVALINGVHDNVFPIDKLQEAVDVRQVDGVYSVDALHNEVILNPKKMNTAISHALGALARKSEAASAAAASTEQAA
jgi:hypothetical protein